MTTQDRWIVVALGIATQLVPFTPPPEVIVMLMPLPPVTAPPPAVIPVPHVTTIVTHAPPDDPFGDLGPCPEPVTSAPRGALSQPSERLEHVITAARDARRVAAWDREYVHASDDGGRTWRRVLDGPGRVIDAAFDCHGRLMVYRSGGRLGVQAQDTARWIDLDGLQEPPEDPDERPPDLLVLGGGPFPAVVGAADDDGDWKVRVAIALDGEHWQYADLGHGERDALDGAAFADGTIRVVVPWVDCKDEGMVVHTLDPARGVERSTELGYDGTGDHPVTARTVFARSRHAWLPGELVAGSRPFAWAEGDVWTLSARKARRVTASWPADATPHDVDLAGRVWGIDTYGDVIRVH